jgi:hypothetical protein
MPLFWNGSTFIDIVSGIVRKRHDNLVDRLFQEDMNHKITKNQIELKVDFSLGEVKGEYSYLTRDILKNIGEKMKKSRTPPFPFEERPCDSYLFRRVVSEIEKREF